jgi:PEP-CTERM motif
MPIRSVLVPFICAAAIVLVAGAQTPSHATPVSWTLENVNLADGATLTGSFSYDADTATYSNFNIVVSGGTLFTGVAFTHLGNSGYAGNQSFQAIPAASTIGDGSATGNPYLFLDFTAPLTDAGGTLSLFHGYYDGIIDCGNAYCSSATGSQATVVYSAETGYGSITTDVPEPVSLAILGAGLVGLAGIRRASAAAVST